MLFRSVWEWQAMFTGFYFPPTTKKTILGGIVGLFAGLLLAKTWLRSNRPVLDHFAIALPIAMAISRIGCLMSGCCFGTVTKLPWGIVYGTSSKVYAAQLSNGVVNFHDRVSAIVHPIQVYELLGCLLIAFLVWVSRKYWKADGSMFLFSVLCYALLRFLVEFIRDPESSFVMTHVSFGIKAIQWAIMGFMVAGGSILAIREKGTKPASTVPPPIFISNSRQVLLAVFLCIITFPWLQWFTLLERSMILLFMVPVILVILVKVYQGCSRHAMSFFQKKGREKTPGL